MMMRHVPEMDAYIETRVASLRAQLMHCGNKDFASGSRMKHEPVWYDTTQRRSIVLNCIIKRHLYSIGRLIYDWRISIYFVFNQLDWQQIYVSADL